MNDRLTAPASVPAGTYGSATDGINRILRLGHEIRPFRSVRVADEADMAAIQHHLVLYERATKKRAAQHPMVVIGDGTVLQQLWSRTGWRPDSVQSSDVWSWSLHESLKEGLDASPTKLELFKPPLWDFPGIPNVVKQLSIAPPRNSLDHVPSPERPVFWELACAMELKFWAALESELLFGGDLQTNPYWPVLQLAGRGLYSLGFDGDAFVVFGREHSDIAAPQS